MSYLSLAGRICLALIFLQSGIGKISGFQGLVGAIASKGLPIPAVLAAGTIVFMLLGSISLIVGYKTQVGALLLILFLIPATLFFHFFTGDVSGGLKNIALIGGLLMVMANGPGLISVDGGK